jgi:hypothetical protein
MEQRAIGVLALKSLVTWRSIEKLTAFAYAPIVAYNRDAAISWMIIFFAEEFAKICTIKNKKFACCFITS